MTRRVRLTCFFCPRSFFSLACLSLVYQETLPSPSFQKRLQEDDQQSIPGEWDEFDKARPLNKGAGDFLDEVKNSFDNLDKTDDREDNGIRGKKEVQNQIQESNTQMSFKVICRIFWWENFSVHCLNKKVI